MSEAGEGWWGGACVRGALALGGSEGGAAARCVPVVDGGGGCASMG